MLAVLFILALAVGVCFSQQQPQQQPAPQGDQAAPAPQEPSAKDKEKKDKKDKKEKKEKKKKDQKDSKSEDQLDTESVFSAGVANNVLNDLRDGLEGHSQRLMLSAFDQDKMAGYMSFEDQIQALFQKYDSFRVHYRIAQSTIEGSKGVVLVDFEMEEIPRTGGTPQRRNGSLRFEMERGRKGWKIVDFNPRGFFS
jgi:hypothetical protein